MAARSAGDGALTGGSSARRRNWNSSPARCRSWTSLSSIPLDEAEYLRESAGVGEMLGQSAPMKELFNSLKRVAATDATVLVPGETGTGKELIASSIHTGSARREKLLVRVNCAAMPGTLLESESFGHEQMWSDVRKPRRRAAPTTKSKQTLNPNQIDATVKLGYNHLRHTVHIKGDGTREQFENIHRTVMATSPNYFNMRNPIPLKSRLIIGTATSADAKTKRAA